MADTFLKPLLWHKISSKLSEQQHKPGLYLVATPIGNLMDITLRAIDILGSAACVLAEDTRQTKKLLSFYEIDQRVISCHEYNEQTIASTIEHGKIYAFVSDAGTPTISDPGYRLVQYCVNKGIEVIPIPGPCAPIAAICTAGLPTNHFTFYGFSDSKSNGRRILIKQLRARSETAIFLESPRRLLNFLKDALELLDNRQVCICRELTKIHEEVFRGSLIEAIDHFSHNEPKGEFVIVLAGNDSSKTQEEITDVIPRLKELLKTCSLKNAVSTLSEETLFPKKQLYSYALKLQQEQDNEFN